MYNIINYSHMLNCLIFVLFCYYYEQIVTELTYRKIIEHKLDYTVVARAIRFFPTAYEFSGCMTVELYGYVYISFYF